MLECRESLPKGCNLLEIPKNETDKPPCTSNPGLYRLYEKDPLVEKCKCYQNCNFLRYEISIRDEEEKKVEKIPDNVTILHVISVESRYVKENERFITYALSHCKKISKHQSSKTSVCLSVTLQHEQL